MQPMITNGGPHPADKWADMTTGTILDLVQVPEDSVTPEAASARQVKRDLRGVLFDIFMAHHSGVQAKEKGDLAKVKKPEDARRLSESSFALHDDVHSTLDQVNEAISATPFADHFKQQHVQDVLRTMIGQHTADVQHIERCWHVDRLEKKGL